MKQITSPGWMHETSARTWCTGKTQRDRVEREVGGGLGWGTHVNPWLIHVNVWQKPLQYCKVISLQLIKVNEKKKLMIEYCRHYIWDIYEIWEACKTVSWSYQTAVWHHNEHVNLELRGDVWVTDTQVEVTNMCAIEETFIQTHTYSVNAKHPGQVNGCTLP